MRIKNQSIKNIKDKIAKQYFWFKNFLIINCNHNDIRCFIPKSTKLPHSGLNVVMSKNVTIGKNCMIRQGCTFGQRHGTCNISIGNNVNFGCNVSVLGIVHIGNNCKIGANSVILKDVPDNKTVVGVWK